MAGKKILENVVSITIFHNGRYHAAAYGKLQMNDLKRCVPFLLEIFGQQAAMTMVWRFFSAEEANIGNVI